MKMKHFSQLFLAVILVVVLASVATADDGVMFRRNVSRTPDGETEDALINMMEFYVPAQAADGTVLTEGIDYIAADGQIWETRLETRPLLASYIDDIMGHEDEMTVMSGISFGHRDTFISFSLDDGATWKDTNLSRSADLSSFNLANGSPYPGDVFAAVSATAGNRVMAAWVSRYCDGGKPAYTWLDDEGNEIFPDLFGVAGNQNSVDYTLQGFPEVGEIPYACVWTARGELQLDETTGSYDVYWRQAERLTSGRRDANRLEIAAEPGAGFIITWQEDPEGLRPGQGLGPGEGWSGAVVNAQTDIWYSHIAWDDFGLVQDEDGNPVDPPDPAEYEGRLWPGVPMAIPVRLTDNAMCRYADDPLAANADDPYCYEDFDLDGIADFCAEEINWTNPGGTTLSICQTYEGEGKLGRVLWGRVGASRARIGLVPYDTGEVDEEGNPILSAWVVMAYEESKALGEADQDLEPIDIGKNIWYHTFEMDQPEVVSRGNILNQPAVDPTSCSEDGTNCSFFDLIEPEEDFLDVLYETEISRRFSMIVQWPEWAVPVDEGGSGTILFALYKQGIINQGGPADIFARRFVLPDDYEPTEDNPYVIENMICGENEASDWAFNETFGQPFNPNYPGGICLAPAINVSGTTDTLCNDGACKEITEWPALEEPPTPMPRVEEWEQTVENLDDFSWENPYDVAKGHRGFLDGDFLMVMYAWSPNWKANSIGNDKYNLYLRRSFDGGQTWTTTPTDWWDTENGPYVGSEHCENYLTSDELCEPIHYAAGEFEPAWNVSQLTGTRITVLDPRYTPTRDSICEDVAEDGTCLSYLYEDDERNHSRFYVVYETGDNTTVDVGEATPMDLYYSRGNQWGDSYEIEEFTTNSGQLVERWDWLENQLDDLSGEASVTTNPGGNLFYSVWNQWQELEEDVITNSDAWYRRVIYIDDMDVLPSVVGFWYAPHAVDLDSGGEVSFAGVAKDNDRLGEGIVAHRWRSSIDGLLSDQKAFSLPADSLSPGLHKITFTAKDNEGNWAQEVEFYLLVAEELQQVYLPMAPGD